MPSLLDSPKYRKFVADRDKYLEQIHTNAQTDISRILFEALSQIEGFIGMQVTRFEASAYNLKVLQGQLETYILHVFSSALPQVTERVKRLRMAVFTITYTSEQEAIGRAFQKWQRDQNYEQFKHRAKDAETLLEKNLDNQVWLSLMKLRYRICNAYGLALIQELSPSEIIEKVQGSFPKIKDYKRPPRELKPLREADTKPKKEIFDTGFFSDSDWDLAIDAYKDTELPPSRFDYGAEFDEETGVRRYSWEMEQDVTDDFVNQVRQGQVAAANDLGIKDFVWVAIIDDRTDDCCLERNGHTTKEIEHMLDQGRLDADRCDATVPPAHPNCRCQLAPVGEVSEVEGPDWKDFNDWLES